MSCVIQSWTTPDSLLPSDGVLRRNEASAQPGTACTWYQLAIERHSQPGIIGDCAFQVLEDDERQARIGFTLRGFTRNKAMRRRQ